MVLEEGDKIHVATRRLFPEEIRRHFAGQVQSVEGGLARLEGHAFILRPTSNEWVRRPEVRTRIISLSDAGNIVNVLPRTVVIGQLGYRTVEGRLLITDGNGYRLDVNEFGPDR